MQAFFRTSKFFCDFQKDDDTGKGKKVLQVLGVLEILLGRNFAQRNLLEPWQVVLEEAVFFCRHRQFVQLVSASVVSGGGRVQTWGGVGLV